MNYFAIAKLFRWIKGSVLMCLTTKWKEWAETNLFSEQESSSSYPVKDALICSVCLVMPINTNFCLDKLVLVISVLNEMSSHVYLYSSTIYTALVSWNHLFVCCVFGLNLTMLCCSKEYIVRRELLSMETALAPSWFVWSKASTLVRFLPVLCWENKILSFSLAHLLWHRGLMPFSSIRCCVAFRILQNAGEELARG